jgi:hypothetical protein
MEGIALIAYIILATGLSGRGICSACFYMVGPPEDKLQLWLQLLFGP